MIELSTLANNALFSLYSDLIEEIRKRKLIRSSNNPVADYGEYLISQLLRLKLVEGSNKGFDAVNEVGIRYQIKTRRITKHNQSRQLGVIRNLEEKLFDFLIVVIFNSDFTVKEIWKIPHGIIKQYSRFSKLQNGYILILKGKILSDPSVQRIDYREKPETVIISELRQKKRNWLIEDNLVTLYIALYNLKDINFRLEDIKRIITHKGFFMRVKNYEAIQTKGKSGLKAGMKSPLFNELYRIFKDFNQKDFARLVNLILEVKSFVQKA